MPRASQALWPLCASGLHNFRINIQGEGAYSIVAPHLWSSFIFYLFALACAWFYNFNFVGCTLIFPYMFFSVSSTSLFSFCMKLCNFVIVLKSAIEITYSYLLLSHSLSESAVLLYCKLPSFLPSLTHSIHGLSLGLPRYHNITYSQAVETWHSL